MATFTTRIRLTAAAIALVAVPISLAPAAGAANDAPVLCDGIEATIVGTPGDDVIFGTEGPDVIAVLQGNDFVDALGGDDIICGGQGDDVLYGGEGFDVIFGAQGNDILDAVYFNETNDTAGSRMYGCQGDDLILGLTIGTVRRADRVRTPSSGSRDVTGFVAAPTRTL